MSKEERWFCIAIGIILLVAGIVAYYLLGVLPIGQNTDGTEVLRADWQKMSALLACLAMGTVLMLCGITGWMPKSK